MRAARPAALTLLLLTLAACGGGGGSSGGSTIPTPPPISNGTAYADTNAYASTAGASLTTPNEGSAVTNHTMTLAGQTLNYTATAGHLTASDLQSGQPKASFFYVAYTLKDQNTATRPVTFFYNGGPGSATVWLHLGSYGPKRLQVGFPATTQSLPFPLVDNAETLLDKSDLVFVDAIGSGFSQAISPNTNQRYWGVDADAEAFRDFVIRYLNVNQRTASPKFIVGESYGGIRTPILADLLESAGVRLSGLVLLSPILDYNSNCAVYDPGRANCAGFFPSYGSTGAYFKLSKPVPTDYAAYADTLRTFTADTYKPAVDTWLVNFTAADSLINQLVAYTGASANLWSSNLSLFPTTFQSDLIPGTQLGRYDARVTAPRGSALASEGDPSSTFITSGFTSTIRSHLGTVLGYTAQSSYTISSGAINTWDWRHDGRALPDVLPDLVAARLQNPRLQVMVMHGYNDLATPFHQTELDLARLSSQSGIRRHVYEGGHMMYLDDASRLKSKADLAAFYTAATAAPITGAQP